MGYCAAGAIFLFVCYRLWTKRDKVAQVYRRLKSNIEAQKKKLKEEREQAFVEQMLKLSRNMSNLTADDLRDPEKFRKALQLDEEEK